MRKRSARALVAMSFTLVACGGKPDPAPTAGGDASAQGASSDRRDYVGRDEPVDPAQLVFEDPALGDRFDRLGRCFAATGAREGWSHYPLRKIGNFVQEDWCRGAGSSGGCAGGAFRDRPGSEWLSRYALHYDSGWPEVFGLGTEAGKLPPDGGWGVRFSYHTGGRGVIGEGLYVDFIRFEGREQAAKVSLGDGYACEVEESHLSVRAPGTMDDELALLLASPASLRETAVARMEALLGTMRAAVASGEVRKCVHGPYLGDGVPPVCTLAELTDEERRRAVERAETFIGDQRRAVLDNAEVFHRLLKDVLDFERCW
jgi:hypothetical protein